MIPGNTKNQFNLAAQSARQAGSTFKSFVLAAAIEKGADPDSTYYTSAPFTCTSGPWCEDDYKAGKPWQVATYGHTYVGIDLGHLARRCAPTTRSTRSSRSTSGPTTSGAWPSGSAST